MHLQDLILKYRTYQGDLIKKDGTLYIPKDLSEGTNLDNRGQQSNQEITDLAVDAVNMLINSLAEVAKKKVPFVSYGDMATIIPEYIEKKQANVTFVAPSFVGDVLSLPDANYAYFISATIAIDDFGVTKQCQFVDKYFLDQIIDSDYDEVTSIPFTYARGTSPETFVLAWPNAPYIFNNTAGTFTVHYIKRQEHITLENDGTMPNNGDIILDPKFDDKIVDIMIKRYELSIRKMTQP